MSFAVQLRPNGHTVATGGSIFGGSGSVEAALSDASDVTGVQLVTGGGTIVVQLAAYISFISGDQIKSIQPKMRYAVIDSGAKEKIVSNVNDNTDPPFNALSLPAAAHGTIVGYAGPLIYGPTPTTVWTVALLNALDMSFVTDNPVGGGTPSRVNLHDIWVEVIELSPPTVLDIAPAGLISDSTPTVSWTFQGDTDPTGTVREPQTRYRVKVFRESIASVGGFNPATSTAFVYDSGEVISAASTAAIPIILNDDDYRFYVIAAQARGHYSGYAYSSVTITHAPDVPILLSPNSGATIDVAAGFTADWTYTHPNGVAMAAYAFRRATDGGAYQYWRQSDQTWQSTIQWNTSTTSAKTFAASDWTDGHSFAWSVASKDALGLTSEFASDSTLIGRTPPTVAISTPNGTVTTTTRPTVTWSFTDGASRPEDLFQVRIYTLADTIAGGFDALLGSPVYDSGIVTGPATSIVPTFDFPPTGTQYVAFVRAQAGGQWSSFDSSQFNCTVTAPTAPLSITATENATTNAIDVVVTGQAEAGFTGLRTIVERQLPGGAWEQVRFASALVPDVSHIARVTDFEVPARTTVSYRARISGVSNSTGFTVTSLNSSTATASTNPGSWWLRDVLTTTTRTAIAVADGLELTMPVKAGVFDTVADGHAVVISDTFVRSSRGSLSLWVKNATVENAVAALLVPGRTLLVQDVLNQQWYVQLSGDMTKRFLRSIDPTLPRAHAYELVVPVVEVSRPSVS